ncbi:MAG: hypothetical protein RL701_2664, partial [Pseudomonadota bacterium]
MANVVAKSDGAAGAETAVAVDPVHAELLNVAAANAAPEALAVVRAALNRSQPSVWQTQRADGGWDSPGEMGPITTAQAVMTLHHMQRLDPRDAVDAAHYLRRQQKSDGSFVLYPGAQQGDLGSTACAWAALQLTAAADSVDAIARARTWIDRHGGLDGVVKAMELGDFSAVYLTLSGFIRAEQLACPTTWPLLLPPVVDFL